MTMNTESVRNSTDTAEPKYWDKKFTSPHIFHHIF